MASPNPLDLEITVISAKHLKNVNWRNGDLKPYAVLYLDPDYRLATHSDEFGSTRPVWNERFTLPLTRPVRDSVLTLEIFHSRVSEIPKPLVGSLKLPIAKLLADSSDESTQSIRNLELLRPSGRAQGKVRVKISIKERPLPPPPPPPPTIQDYQNTPDYSHYFYSVPPPFPSPSPAPPRDYGYYSGYYSPQPPPQPRPSYNRAFSMPAGSVPSAPVDFSSSNDYKPPPLPTPQRTSSNYCVTGSSGPSAPVDYTPYDQKLQKQMGELSIEEEVTSNPKEKRPESELAKREGSYSYGDYRHAHDY